MEGLPTGCETSWKAIAGARQKTGGDSDMGGGWSGETGPHARIF